MRSTWLKKAMAIAVSATMVLGSTPVASLAAGDDAQPEPEPAIEQVATGGEDESGDVPAVPYAAPAPDAGSDEGTDGEPGDTADPTPAPVTETGIVYLDGVKGNDANDGATAATAVKTFAKAKELLGSDGTEIRLVNTVTITSDETWTLGEGRVLIRDESFTCGPMIRTNPGLTLTLENIVIDGGYGTANEGVMPSEHYQNGASIIDANFGTAVSPGCSGKGIVNLNDGAVLRNNRIIGSHSSYGGGIRAVGTAKNPVEININGGAIRNCTVPLLGAGGGIYLFDSTYSRRCAVLNMLAGVIDSCSSNSGGGVYLYCAIMNQSGGTISNCTSNSVGGGVCVDYVSLYSLTGGTIKGNTAKQQGGGICITYYSDAIVNGTVENPVRIEGNTSLATNPDENNHEAMGGGGIYVNTELASDGGYVSTLKLGPSIITGNSAKVDGGGVALCPTGGQTEGDYTNVYAIFGNSVDGNGAKDFVVVRNATTTSDNFRWTVQSATEFVNPNISSTMLGGGAYNWLDRDGNEYPLDQLQGVNDFFGTSSVEAGSEEVAAAESLATVYFTGNRAECFGGAIANNGMILHYNTPDTVDLSIFKYWHTDINAPLPSSIRMHIVRSDGYRIGFIDIQPDQDGNWEGRVYGLAKTAPNGTAYQYTLEEEILESNSGDWKVNVETSTDEKGNITATATNTEVVALHVSKRDVSGNELPGAKMQVLDSNQNVVEEWISDGTVHVVGLGTGTYTLHEESAPSGYLVANDIAFDVDVVTRTITPKGSTTAADDNLIVMVDDAVPGPTTTVTTTVTTTTTTSPNTGEPASVAGIVAVAGVAALALSLRRRRLDA